MKSTYHHVENWQQNCTQTPPDMFYRHTKFHSPHPPGTPSTDIWMDMVGCTQLKTIKWTLRKNQPQEMVQIWYTDTLQQVNTNILSFIPHQT